MAASDNAALAGDREIVITRVLDAPRELVWRAYTDPGHLAHWWGPQGFRTTTERMEVRPGGVWRFVMHAPDGRDYDNLVTYLEVKAPERLVYRQSGGDGGEPVQFETTITFEDWNGRTRLTVRGVFPTPEARDEVERKYGAVEGLTQTIDRLQAYLPRMTQV